MSDKPKPLWISPTDLETTELCARKHWFKKVLRIPEVIKGSSSLGTGLHGVVERYLRADDLGRNPDGQPVNLYPEGWHVVTERDGRSYVLSPAEQDIIRKLVDKAIEGGFLVREPGRKIEHLWRMPAPGYEDRVVLNGKIDVLAGPKVDDHKTVKAMRWAKSPRDLAESIQMNLYGMVAVQELVRNGEPNPGEIAFKHIIYCKDPDDLRVRTSTASKPVADIAKFYQGNVVPLIEKILSIQKVEKWHEIDDPPNMAKSCNAYGGCSFQSICHGREKPEDYKKRLLSSPEARVDLTALKPSKEQAGESSMGMLQDLIGKSKAPPAAAEGPPINSAPQAASAPAPPPAAEPAGDATAAARAKLFGAPPAAPLPTPPGIANAPASPLRIIPPWAFEECPACWGGPNPGWNTLGAPCRICDSMSGKAGRPISTWFAIVGEKQNAVWELRPEYAEAGIKAGPPGSAPIPGTGGDVKAETKEFVAPPAKVREDAPEPESPPPTTQQVVTRAREIIDRTPEPDPEPEIEKRKVGRPKIGITLLIGCVSSRNADSKIRLAHFDKLFDEYSAGLAQQQGVASYWEMDAFRRRDALASKAAPIADALANSFVVVSPSMLGTPDHRHFLSALRACAGVVFEFAGSAV